MNKEETGIIIERNTRRPLREEVNDASDKQN